MAELERVRHWANALIRLHLDPTLWTFGFDNAKARAGQCNFTAHQITVSRHVAVRSEDDDIHQVLLHEVAHALVGPRVGHGPQWRDCARELGYVGGRLHQGSVTGELAPWVGRCPRGHEHYRFRAPTRSLACGACSRRFDPANMITWVRRDPHH